VDLPESFDKDNMTLDSVTHTGGPARMVMARYKQPKENQQEEWRSALRAHRIAAAIPGSCWVKLEEDV